jgi:hypothetical protein
MIPSVSHLQRQSYVFWRLGRVIKKAAPKRNYEFKKSQLFIEFPYIRLSTLKFIQREQFFRSKCLFFRPWTLLSLLLHHSFATDNLDL